jgi:hypothetical protein
MYDLPALSARFKGVQMLKSLALSLLVLVLLALPGAADLVNFDSLALADFQPIPDGYGSTADFSVSYQTLGTAPHLSFVNSNYGDLSKVAISAQHFALAEIRFTANNPGERLTLDKFDLGGAAVNAATQLRILDGNGAVLLDYGDVFVPNAVGHVTFMPGVTSEVLALQFGNDSRIGIDNIELTAVAIPEPSACVCVGAACALLAVRRLMVGRV